MTNQPLSREPGYVWDVVEICDRFQQFQDVPEEYVIASDYAALRAEVEVNKQAFASLREENERLTSEGEMLKSEMGYHEAKDVIEQLTEQRDVFKAENERLNGEPPWCDDDHCQLATLTAKNAALRAEVEVNKQAFASLREENERLMREWAEAVRHIEELVTTPRAVQLLNQNHALERQLAAMTQERDELRTATAALDDQLTSLTQERDAALTRAMESKLNEDSLYRQLAATEARVRRETWLKAAEMAEGKRPVAPGNAFKAQREMCTLIATKCRAQALEEAQ